jgi:hypothetical protein
MEHREIKTAQDGVELDPHAQTDANIIVKRMWEGGPLRNWSPSHTSLAPMVYAKGGYVGSYVCDQCQRSCDGVYCTDGEQAGQKRWVCGGCKPEYRPAWPPPKGS